MAQNDREMHNNASTRCLQVQRTPKDRHKLSGSVAGGLTLAVTLALAPYPNEQNQRVTVHRKLARFSLYLTKQLTVSQEKCVMGKVISLHKAAPRAALESLNRLTGLEFERLPESLVNRQCPPALRAQQHSQA